MTTVMRQGTACRKPYQFESLGSEEFVSAEAAGRGRNHQSQAKDSGGNHRGSERDRKAESSSQSPR